MKQSIKISVMALVAMFAFSTVADAQFGSLLKAAKKAVKKEKTTTVTLPSGETQVVKGEIVIPQPAEKGGPIPSIRYGFFYNKEMNKKQTGFWDPTTLKLTFNKDAVGNGPSVYTINPSSGAVTAEDGSAVGSLSNDGTIVTPNKRTLIMTKKSGSHSFDADVTENGQVIGEVNIADDGHMQLYSCNDGKWSNCTFRFDKTVNPLLCAYAYFGVIYDRKYTTDELDDLVEWNDQESINDIIKYESSLPAAGFKKTNPELKNCKVAAVGLLNNAWWEYSYTQNGYKNWDYRMDYYVVYELADGRNVVTFSRAIKTSKYADVSNKFKLDGETFYEITDWQRK